MSKELKITKEKVLEASEQCGEAKRVLEAMFPEVFRGEWENITDEIKWSVEDGFLHGYYEGDLLMTASSQRFEVSPMSKYYMSEEFKVNHDADKHAVLKRR